MSNEDNIQAIERNIAKAKSAMDLGTALERLRINRDFKKIVLEGYFEQEAIRLVHLKADPNMQKPESQLAILNQIDAIGTLVQYFNTVMFRADLASKSISDDEAMRDELIEEDAK